MKEKDAWKLGLKTISELTADQERRKTAEKVIRCTTCSHAVNCRPSTWRSCRECNIDANNYTTKYSRGCGNCGRSQKLGFPGRSSNLPECALCDKTTPTMWIKREGGNKVEHMMASNNPCVTCNHFVAGKFILPCVSCVDHNRWEEKGMEKQCATCINCTITNCATCFNFSNYGENLKEKKCGTCGRYPNKSMEDQSQCNLCGQGTKWIRRVEEKKVELNLKEVTTVVQVTFNDRYGNKSKDYSFKTNLNLSAGDLVIVDTSTGGATLAYVSNTDITDGRSLKATRWVIQKVDMREHRKRIVKEAKLLALRERMDTRRVQIEDFSIYQHLAMADKKMAILWAEYVAVLEG